MASKVLLSLLMVISILFPCQRSLAEESRIIPLSKLMIRPEAIRLENMAGEFALSFPVPERHRVRSANLVLDFVYSDALIATRSQLRIQVNGVTVAQWRLGPGATHRQESVDIPPELLLSGYNELRFFTAQHYTDKQCEAPASPELWTEINALQSRLEFQYDLEPAPLSLAKLSVLFDRKLPESTVSLLFADANLDEDALHWGGVIAQGIALRMDYAPWQLDLGELKPATGDTAIRFVVPSGRDVVVIAERDKLVPFISEQALAHVTGPYLGLFPVPGNPGRFVLLVSGQNANEVGVAARAFARMNFPLPDAPETVIGALEMAPPTAYMSYPAVQPGRTYSFRQFGFRNVSRHGLRPRPIELEVFFPPDLFAPEDAEVVFRLHLAYNAGMRRDSLLEMKINGIFERAIQLPEEGGAQYRDYRLAVPFETFQPGFNRITFHPLLVPSMTGECLYLQTANLQVTFYQDSKIQLPPASHYTELPDFSLLAGTGFPYLGGGDGGSFAIRLLNRRPDTVLAAWHLLGKLARLNRNPLDQARLSFDAITDDKDLIVMGGNIETLQGELFENLPIGTGRPWNVWSYSLGRRPMRQTAPWWQDFLGMLQGDDAGSETTLADQYVSMEQTGGLGGQALGFSFRHPRHSSRLVTLFMAEDRLYPFMQALAGPELWGQMQGDLILWRPESRILAWQRIGESFYVGEAGVTDTLLFYFSRHPWYWLLAVFALIVLLAWLIHLLLNIFKHRRHPDAEEIAP